MKKDRGWEYLNSSGDDFDYDKDNDGSWGYENEDGSGSFYGNDGSWGYKNSDGSASYYGADGSWGYKNSDGSSSYYGNDGSWGYKNSDGSGSFYGSDGDSEYYDSDDDSDDDDNDYNSSDSGGSVLGTIIGVGLAAFTVAKIAKWASDGSSYDDDEDDDDEDDDEYEENSSTYTVSPPYVKQPTWFDQKPAEKEQKRAEKERIRQEKEELRRQRMRAFYKKHWKGIFLFFVLFGLAGFGAYKYQEFQKGIEVGFAENDIIGLNYENAISEIKESGFTNVYAHAEYDLGIEDAENEYIVTDVSIRGDTSFAEDDKYPYDARVELTYHVVKNIPVPISYKEGKKMLCNDLASMLEEAGFVNVSTVADRDLITGWITKEGSIEEFTVGGETKFSQGTTFRPDVEIVIAYHAFKEK